MILYMTIDERVALIRSEGNVFYAAIGGLYSWATYANDVMVYYCLTEESPCPGTGKTIIYSTAR